MVEINNLSITKGFNLVLAYSYGDFGIGKDNSIPWHIPDDLKFFKTLTTYESNTKENDYEWINAVIMGRKTWDSIPSKYKPLNNRLNIVITRNPELYQPVNFVIFCHLEDLFKIVNSQQIFVYDSINYKIRNNFVIGGAEIYNYFLNEKKNYISQVFITEIYKKYECNVCLPAIGTIFKHCCDISSLTSLSIIKKQCWRLDELSDFKCNIDKTKNEKTYYRYFTFRNLDISHSEINFGISFNEHMRYFGNTEERNYLKLMKNILEIGNERTDRTGVGTLSLFGESLKYDLKDTLPLSTTKRMFFRGILKNL